MSDFTNITVAELIESVNSDHFYCIQDFATSYNVECVASNLYVDSHRWYETSTSVYKCSDGYVGVNGVSQLFSENMGYSDVDCTCIAEEFVPVQSIVYKPKREINS
jgi:hypothetical protein